MHVPFDQFYFEFNQVNLSYLAKYVVYQKKRSLKSKLFALSNKREFEIKLLSVVDKYRFRRHETYNETANQCN